MKKTVEIFAVTFIWVALQMGAFAQKIATNEISDFLNNFKNSENCLESHSRKLFYLSNGLRSREAYIADKLINQTVSKVFPDLQIMDIGRRDQQNQPPINSDGRRAGDRIETYASKYGAGIYLFVNMEQFQQFGVVTLSLKSFRGVAEDSTILCSNRYVLVSEVPTNLTSEIIGIKIQGDVSNSGAGDVNISNTNITLDDASKQINSLEDANFLLSAMPNAVSAAKLIPIRIGSKLNFQDLVRISGHSIADVVEHNGSGVVEFKDGSYSFSFKDGFLHYEHWTLDAQEEPSFKPWSIKRHDARNERYVEISPIGVTLGRDSFQQISDLSVLDKGEWEVGETIDCWPSTSGAGGSDLFILACQTERIKAGKWYIFSGREIDPELAPGFNQALDLMTRSKYIPMNVSVYHHPFYCDVPSQHTGSDCVINEDESSVPGIMSASYATRPIPREFLDDFEQLTDYRIYRFINSRYLGKRDSESNIRNLYHPTLSLKYMGRRITLNDLIKLKIKPLQAGSEINYYPASALKWQVISQDILKVEFESTQFFRKSGCRRWQQKRLQFDIVIQYDMLNMFVVEEDAQVLSDDSSPGASCNQAVGESSLNSTNKYRRYRNSDFALASGDIYKEGLRLGVSACLAKCNAMSSCVGFAFINKSNFKGARCWIKSAVGARRSISGVDFYKKKQ